MSERQAKITHQLEGHIAVITIDNPPANTWTAESLVELETLILTLNRNRDIYALVLTGSGEKFFSTGADLRLFSSGDTDVANEMAQHFGRAFETLSAFRGVSIAAINGYAMGGGLEAALACDIRIAEQQVILALPEAKVGLLPCAGGTQNLTALVGEGWAKRIILCGEQLSAEKAQSIGLVEEVVGKGEALSKAMELADMVANQSPSSVTACKALIQNSRSNSIESGLVKEREYFLKLFETNDQVEGVNAFLQKRPPQWTNS